MRRDRLDRHRVDRWDRYRKYRQDMNEERQAGQADRWDMYRKYRQDINQGRHGGQAQGRQVGQVQEIQAGHERGETGWTGTE
jgi:hypothetical protein